VTTFSGVDGPVRYNPYDLYDVAVSHSFVAAVSWSLAAAGAWFAVTRSRLGAVVVGGAVFSHFLLDLPMHTPDLPLAYSDGPKLGFGLWNHPALALAAELLLVGAGAFFYARNTPRVTRRTRWFFIVLLALTVATPVLPAPPGPMSFAAQALAAYVALALYAHWVERGDSPPSTPASTPESRRTA